MTAEAVLRTVTEFGARLTQTGNVWSGYPTRAAAQEFADEAPLPMHVVKREWTGDTHGPWVRA